MNKQDPFDEFVMFKWPQTMNWFFETASCDRRPSVFCARGKEFFEVSRRPSVVCARRKERSLAWNGRRSSVFCARRKERSLACCAKNAVFLLAH